jgi:mannose-6-phosphate isomerase
VSVTKLVERRVEKPWGRYDLPEMFGTVDPGGEPVGEIWFQHPGGEDAELLVKYLFTSERLSIQVHPDDEGARRAGHKRGKEEAWVLLRADPDAVIGIGLREPVGKEQLRKAALDGSIEQLLDWRPAAVGDIYYSPAGTVHALGPGLTLIEIQQNVDVTYRIYDYGRPRELHLDQAIEASNPVPYTPPMQPYLLNEGREILAHGRAFVLERWTAAVSGELRASADSPVWLVPVRGGGTITGEGLEPGTAWIADGPAAFSLEAGSDLLLAYPGGEVRPHLVA